MQFYEFYAQHKIYFSPLVCTLIANLLTIASNLAFNYPNIALKDKEGNLYANPEVKRLWGCINPAYS
jgi:hypothetical protein